MTIQKRTIVIFFLIVCLLLAPSIALAEGESAEQEQEKNIINVAWEEIPETTVYAYGKSLDVSGGSILVEYDDESLESVALTEDMVTGYQPNVCGDQELTVNVGDGRKLHYTVTVQHSYGSWTTTEIKKTGTAVSELQKRTCAHCGHKEERSKQPANGFYTISGTKYYVISGAVATGKTGLISDGTKYLYVKQGVWQNAFTGFASYNEKIRYIKSGVWQNSYTGLVKYNEKFRYVKSGIWQNTFTGFATYNDKVRYIKSGIWQNGYTGLVKYSEKFRYVRSGIWQNTFTGFASYNDKIRYIKSGIWQNSFTGYVKYNDKYRYVKAGIWQNTTTGLVQYDTTWRYVKAGIWQNGFTGLAEKTDGWWYVKKGTVDKTALLATTYNGSKWIVEKGKARKATSESDLTYYRALTVVAKVTNASMTEKQKLKACFDYVKTAYRESRPRTPNYTGKDWPVIYANDMFVRGTGNCCSYAAAFAYLAKACGAEKVYACNSGGHGWVEINGLVYDPEWSKHSKKSTYFGISLTTKVDVNYRTAIKRTAGWQYVKIS